MNILVEEVVNGCGDIDGRGDGSGDNCYGYSDGRGWTGYVGTSVGFYFEPNNKYFGIHTGGRGYAGQQHLNVSYDSNV
jgi:hypothetical protein